MFNSRFPGRYGGNIRSVFLEHKLRIKVISTSYEMNETKTLDDKP